MSHQSCCSSCTYQAVRTSPPTTLTLVSSCTFRSCSCSWSCSTGSDISVKTEVGTRRLGEGCDGREEPCEGRPTRQAYKIRMAAASSSPYNPKRWTFPIYLATNPRAASPLLARSFYLMFNLNFPTHSLDYFLFIAFSHNIFNTENLPVHP